MSQLWRFKFTSTPLVEEGEERDTRGAEAADRDHGPDAAPQGQQRQQQQVLVMEIQDRFGCLFLDYRGNQWCMMFGFMRLLVWALRGVLLGLFVGEFRDEQ